MKILFTLLSLILISCVLHAQQCNPLDTTFGFNGKVTTSMSPETEDVILETKIKDNGQIITAGYFTGLKHPPNLAIAYYNSNGTLDKTYGNNGKLKIALGIKQYHFVSDIKIQGDGKIVVAAYAFINELTRYDFVLLRFTKDCIADSSFGLNGRVITDIQRLYNTIPKIAVQADGKIVLAGGASFGESTLYWTILRYNKNGSTDSSFAYNGVAFIQFSDYDQRVEGLAIQPDGKILITGYFDNGPHGYDQIIVRYHNNGKLDRLFGEKGKVITDVIEGRNDFPSDIAIRQNGKILVSGLVISYQDPFIHKWVVFQYLNNGMLDSSFAKDGIANATFDSLNGSPEPKSILILPNEAVVVGGASHNAFVLVNYKPNGTLDESFGCNGIISTPFDSHNARLTKLTLQKDGKIVAAGYVHKEKKKDFALARYNIRAVSLSINLKPLYVKH